MAKKGSDFMALDEFAEERARLVEEISAYAFHTGERTGRKSFDTRVLDAIGRVPRHEFVPLEIRRFSYINRPLPIGMDATISQPFIVALMTDLAEIGPQSNVLEIGTGAGYQAAVASLMAARVASVEINERLEEKARARLERLGYKNIATKVGDGYYGWPDKGPFDAILVTTAPDLIPPPLIEQLAPGGRMIIPAGLPDAQKLMLVTRNGQGRLVTREVLEVAFSQLQRAGHA
jgi:protein-L-isoaspartate(D-aspartate) O-methyltransferase